MIHTTIGVYNNDSYKINGVRSEYIGEHIKYNVTARPGRALFVDGHCVYQGYLDKERCDAWERKIRASGSELILTEDTQPYH